MRLPVVDADALVAALARPVVVIAGREYVGVPLSAVEQPRLAEEAKAVLAVGDARAHVAFARAVFDALFPRPWWAVWRRRVSSRLLRLPATEWVPILAGFSAALQQGSGAPRTTPSPTSGPTPRSA